MSLKTAPCAQQSLWVKQLLCAKSSERRNTGYRHGSLLALALPRPLQLARLRDCLCSTMPAGQTLLANQVVCDIIDSVRPAGGEDALANGRLGQVLAQEPGSFALESRAALYWLISLKVCHVYPLKCISDLTMSVKKVYSLSRAGAGEACRPRQSQPSL